MFRVFSKGYKAVLEHVNATVLTSFANFLNGTEILKLVLKQLLASYTRFLDIVRTAWRRPPAFCKDLVTTSNIMAEVRTFSTFS